MVFFEKMQIFDVDRLLCLLKVYFFLTEDLEKIRTIIKIVSIQQNSFNHLRTEFKDKTNKQIIDLNVLYLR